MKSKAAKVIVIFLCAALIVALLLSLSLCSRPRAGEYESEHGTHYRIDGETITRLSVPTEISVGTQSREITVNVVYAYEIYSESFETRISMRLMGIEYEGKDQAVKNLAESFNRSVAAGGAESYEFATLYLKAVTDGEYARGAGTLRINGELLRRK